MGKRRLEDRSTFDKRLRFSVRQTESAYRYRDIVVKKQDSFTYILLSTKSSEDNTLNPEFRKPIVAAVNGPALGLGAALLPLCDVVWANEKAWFQTPYMFCGQTPDGCSSFTFPRIMGVYLSFQANELLLGGRKLTAQEACSKGLVSQVLWPGTFTQEVMLRVKELVGVDSQVRLFLSTFQHILLLVNLVGSVRQVLQESKALMRNTSRSSLEQANERECEALKRVWGSLQGTDSILQYLQKRTELC
ncbi:hypothetical protein XENOCAPTIV_023315 [Xenoophorus captivus]|uniref:Uncharacterized protein n=1 Tax=Xenoophorus captivus TaxID=1517983 RepID=A0ABV0QJT5_9TELE